MRVALMICSRVLDRHGFNVEHRWLQNVLAYAKAIVLQEEQTSTDHHQSKLTSKILNLQLQI